VGNIRLLILCGVWPHHRGNLEAANVVAYEIVRHLVSRSGWAIAFCVLNAETPVLSAEAAQDVAALKQQGLTILDPVVLDSPRLPRMRRWLGELRNDPCTVLAGCAASSDVAARAREWRADALLTIWSEAATVAASSVGLPLLTYYGNPDHKVFEAGVQFHWERGSRSFASALRFARARLLARAIRRAHVQVMRRCALIAEVAANDASYYQANGLSSAVYVRNMWPVTDVRDQRHYRREHEQLQPAKLVASVGNLSATGNTLGFDTLTRQLLPSLKRVLGEKNFELHVFGGRRPNPLVARLLEDPHIRLRGFVADLDCEILSAPIFLVANNHRYFKVGHTRFLHAWSLGACVVAFRDSAEAMPELVHGENALLASSADEFAENVRSALDDRELRERLGTAGQRTLLEKFRPERVCTDLEQRMRQALGRGQQA
jgi:glycosyltransferase involved in cell wall biosynthesis